MLLQLLLRRSMHEALEAMDCRGEPPLSDERVQAGRMWGHLAFAGDQPVGWCGAGPKDAIPIFQAEPKESRNQVGAITCFVVAPAFRGQGVARQLLKGVLEDFAAMKLGIAEGYPRREAKTAAENHFGPLALFYSEGFCFYQDDPSDGSGVVRKRI